MGVAMILADNDLYLILSGLAAIFGLYWWAVTAAMRREMRELQEEIERNLGPAPEGWDAVRTIERERRQ